jgi:hypothetical protein
MGIALATLAVALVATPRRTSRAGGAFLLGLYAVVAVTFYLVGDR